jgi:hypothetical protein
MHIVPVLCGIGCVAAFGVATYSRDADARRLALLLCGTWAAANLLWLLNILEYLPVLDWLIGVQAVVISATRSDKWVRLFIWVIALRLTLHVVDYLTGHAFLVQYIHGLNATFALLLMAVSYAGGCHARDTMLGHLHRLGARLRNPLQARSQGLNP